MFIWKPMSICWRKWGNNCLKKWLTCDCQAVDSWGPVSLTPHFPMWASEVQATYDLREVSLPASQPNATTPFPYFQWMHEDFIPACWHGPCMSPNDCKKHEYLKLISKVKQPERTIALSRSNHKLVGSGQTWPIFSLLRMPWLQKALTAQNLTPISTW